MPALSPSIPLLPHTKPEDTIERSSFNERFAKSSLTGHLTFHRQKDLFLASLLFLGMKTFKSNRILSTYAILFAKNVLLGFVIDPPSRNGGVNKSLMRKENLTEAAQQKHPFK